MARLSIVFGLLLSLAFAAPVLAQQQPQITITSPVAGSTVSGPDVTVTITVSGTTLVPAAQATKRDDLHVHYLLDRAPTPYLSGTTPIPMGDANIVHSGALSNTFSGVAPGSHQITVLLGYADHTAFQPLVAPSVTFTVGGQASTPAQLPRTGDASGPGTLLIVAGFVGLLLGLVLRTFASRFGHLFS